MRPFQTVSDRFIQAVSDRFRQFQILGSKKPQMLSWDFRNLRNEKDVITVIPMLSFFFSKTIVKYIQQTELI